MSRTELFDQVKQILVERFAIDPAQITPTADLEKTLKLDSMDAMDLLMTIDETFSIRIPEKTLDDVHTLSELVAVIEKHIPKKP